MNISSPGQSIYTFTDASSNAKEGIREQVNRLDRKVAEVANSATTDSFASGSRDTALVELSEIEIAARANAKSLQTINQTLGTIIDLEV